MKKIHRFFYVAAPRGLVFHMAHGAKTEGPALCGVQMEKGWSYWLKTPAHAWRRCARCEKAASKFGSIHVMRVRAKAA